MMQIIVIEHYICPIMTCQFTVEAMWLFSLFPSQLVVFLLTSKQVTQRACSSLMGTQFGVHNLE